MKPLKLGERLKEERTKQNISQERLAEKAGVTRRAIIHWENGTRKMNVESADKVFKALQVTIVIGADQEVET